ncbi:MAG TPA: hypothetical protein VNA89_10120 [Gemmatimonadaceae bacterium]|nr:hypothetical protein [Gemmatimonadaceae bacterium]
MRPFHAITGALAALLALGAPALRAQHDHHARAGVAGTAGLGEVAFPNSGAPATQEAFRRGLALLHSFEYEDAADAFREARERDPAFALAHWMEALTYRHGVWGTEGLAEARAVLARLGPDARSRLARARLPRERRFGAAVEALFADAPEPRRVGAWADSLRRLVAEEPGDPEWATFAAIAIMDAMRWMPPAARARARDESAALAERTFAAHPRHPGAAHFVLHANDDPDHAARAERAARAYAEIAPAAEHALHMPSHIFVQLGLWDDAAASNERAWAASRRWVAERGAPTAALSWHALSWLEYSYLQQGRRRAARALIDSARTLLGARSDTIPGIDVRFAVPMMEFLYGATTGSWSEPAPPIRASARNQRAFGFEASGDYWRAVAAHMRGNRGAAANQAARFRRTADSLGTAPGAAFLRSTARQLEALAALAGPDRARGLALLREAAAADTSAPLGPPQRLITAELLGAALLEDGKGSEAAAAFAQALRLTPRRSSALLGLARARKMAGDVAGAAAAYRDLLASWDAADADLPELAEARAGVLAAR